MNYDYFHIKSRNFLGKALHYIEMGQPKDALWCCRVALELENRGLQSLACVSFNTFYTNKLQVKAIEKIAEIIVTR